MLIITSHHFSSNTLLSRILRLHNARAEIYFRLLPLPDNDDFRLTI